MNLLRSVKDVFILRKVSKVFNLLQCTASLRIERDKILIAEKKNFLVVDNAGREGELGMLQTMSRDFGQKVPTVLVNVQTPARIPIARYDLPGHEGHHRVPNLARRDRGKGVDFTADF